jgi:mono/diheme cytochrome c family protein
MTPLPDLLLSVPIAKGLREILLFSGFSLHLFFVLLALGTAFLSVFYFVAALLRRRLDELRWDKQILRTFLAHKSLAVVLGVAPLLLIQVSHSIPFFTAVGLLAPYWLLLILLMMAAFPALDSLGHRLYVHPAPHLILGVIALMGFLIVPGIFSAVLVAAEHSTDWASILRQAGRLRGALALHWLLRYLHVLVAGLILGALFHHFFTSGSDPDKKKRMKSWARRGIFLQLIIGPLLAVYLPGRMDKTSLFFLGAALAALAVLAGHLIIGVRVDHHSLRFKITFPAFVVVFLGMLLIREHQQARGFASVEQAARTAAVQYSAELAPFEKEALNRYLDDVRTVYDNGETVFRKSCAFCHGENGDGQGVEALNLSVPPEDITAVRSDRAYLLEIISTGVAGTGMPHFDIFTRGLLKKLAAYLDEKWDVAGGPPHLTDVPAPDLDKAADVFANVCSGCHGPDGRPAPSARAYRPPPPDFSRFSLLPARALQVINAGYPGTMMPPFATTFPLEVRRALVQVIFNLRAEPNPVP